MKLRCASPTDLVDIEAMLVAASLPVQGVAEHLARFRIATRGARAIGAAGLELYGRAALLRSVVVRSDERGSGVGVALAECIIADAEAAGVHELYLLTTTAPRFFERLGFEPVSRAEVPPELHASAELRGACPATAAAMRRRLVG